jgi:non-specific serine/threonine protein kinase
MELIDDILAEGHKVLIFSQFVKVLHVIRDHFDRQEIRYSYLDGSMKLEQRAEMISEFQGNEEVKTFLLSLKAGGTAITLTAADYVIIFDPWWNPAVEAQAVDRSHRIGQTRNVIVYRLVIANSIEEKMLTLQQKKMDLVDQLISVDLDSQKFKNLTKMEILDLFDLKV